MIKRYTTLYKALVAQFIKQIMQSKINFLMGLLGFFLTQLLGISFLYLIFEQIPELDGWTLQQLIFIYGFAQIPRSIDHLLTDNIWMLAWQMVITGDFDRYLLRPMNVFFQLISEKLQPDAIGELLIGFILVGISFHDNILIIDGCHIVFFIISIVAGAFIYTSIKLFFASLAFWVKQSGPFLQIAYNTADFAKYPIEIYSRTVQFILSWIIPFAFVAYIPASYFLMKKSLISTVGVEVLIAIVFWTISYNFFMYGISKYESVGN